MRWAIVGASDIAATQVIPALRACGVEPSVVMSAGLDWAQEYAKDNQIAHATDDLSTALEQVDAVYVSSTNEKHYRQAMSAIEAGLHVLCEKPLAMSVDEAREMVSAAKDAGVVLATNHHLRNSPVLSTMRDLIASGQIGDLLGVRVAHAVLLPEHLHGWRLEDAAAGGGIVLDITVHDVDTIRFVTGLEPTSISAVAVNQGMGLGGLLDAVMTTGTLGDTTLFSTYDAFTVEHSETSFEVHGTKGTLIGRGCMTPTPDGTLELRHDGRTHSVDTPVVDSLYVPNIKAFLAAVNGTGAPRATGDDGRRSLQTALAALESLTTARRVPLSLNDGATSQKDQS
jgi:1,5-anhydro-D-fructose reductase (1,5-anhydro-D-mannitol-forming)